MSLRVTLGLDRSGTLNRRGPLSSETFSLIHVSATLKTYISRRALGRAEAPAMSDELDAVEDIHSLHADIKTL